MNEFTHDPAPGLPATPKAAEPLFAAANGPSGASPVGNDGGAGAGTIPAGGTSEEGEER